MSATVTRPRLRLSRDLTSGIYTITVIAEPLVGRSPRRPRPWWSRPMPADGCSMVARMPRYAPAASGIRSAPRIPATGQNGSSRHVSHRPTPGQHGILEQSSGLLIRGFGVQVPGGAPVLTWGFIAQVVFFVSVLFTWLIRGCSHARTQQSRACQIRADPGAQRACSAGVGHTSPCVMAGQVPRPMV